MLYSVIIICRDESCGRALDLEFSHDPDLDEIKEEVEERGWSGSASEDGSDHTFYCELHAPESEAGGGL